ncbi:MAG: PKD domain-containing protein [Phycisphaerae bacterium]
MARKMVLIMAAFLGIGAGLHAATVTYDVLFTGQGTVRDITIAPGTPVNITVTAKVDPADPNNPDTDGLALVNLDLSISFGIPQEALTLDPDFQSAFPLFASGGTPASNGGISSIGGAQNTFNPASIKRGKGLGTPMVIATGTLQTPSTPGTYTIATANLGANVLDPAPATTVTRAGTILDNSLTVRIEASGSGGGGGGGGGGATPTNHPPVAIFSYAANANDPLTVNFDASGSSDSDGDPLTYAWTFGDGQTGNGKTAAHKYAAADSYTVVLTVSDGRGGTDAKSVTISVAAASGGGENPPPDNGTNNPPPSSGGGENPPPDNGNNPPPDNGDNNPPSPVVAPMCGAGMVETAMMCTLGLFALQWSRRRD